MALTSEQLRAARALLRWEQKDVSQASRVSLPSIKRLEGKPGLLGAQDRTVEAIKSALEVAGVEFIPENGGGAGVRLAKPSGVSRATPDQMAASATEVRSQAASAADEAMSDMDATKQEKADRRGALTGEPAMVERARDKGRPRK